MLGASFLKFMKVQLFGKYMYTCTVSTEKSDFLGFSLYHKKMINAVTFEFDELHFLTQEHEFSSVMIVLSKLPHMMEIHMMGSQIVILPATWEIARKLEI